MRWTLLTMALRMGANGLAANSSSFFAEGIKKETVSLYCNFVPEAVMVNVISFIAVPDWRSDNALWKFCIN